MEPFIDPAPWKSALLKDQHLAEIQKITEDLEESLVMFSLSVQRSLKTIDDARLQQLYEIYRETTQDKEQILRRESDLSLLQIAKVVGDIDGSCEKQSTDLVAEVDAYRLILGKMHIALIDSIGRLLVEARLGRLESVNAASAAFTQEALETDALASRADPVVKEPLGSGKGSKPLKSILKPPSGSRKGNGLNDSKYS